MLSALPESPPAAPGASDVPVRRPGVHTRSGNAMPRTRGAILDATLACLERYGVRKTTMGDIAQRAKVAKATLYNHFRTRDAVLAALLDREVAALAARCAGEDLAGALRLAALSVARSPALRRAVAEEASVVALVAAPGEAGVWPSVRAALAGLVGSAAGAEVALRFLVSHALWPGTDEEIALGAARLAGLLAAEPPEPPAPPSALGWPPA